MALEWWIRLFAGTSSFKAFCPLESVLRRLGVRSEAEQAGLAAVGVATAAARR